MDLDNADEKVKNAWATVLANLGSSVLDELDAQHQPKAADIADNGVL